MEILETTLTSKFQLTLPKRIREVFGLDVGDKIAFLVEDKDVVLVPKPDDFIKAFGALSGGKSFPQIRAEIKKARAGW